MLCFKVCVNHFVSAKIWHCNFTGIIARHPAFLPYIEEQLTEKAVASYFSHLFEKETAAVKRYHFTQILLSSWQVSVSAHKTLNKSISGIKCAYFILYPRTGTQG